MILPLLVAMLYMTFLQIPLRDVQQAFRNLKFSLSSLLINFVWTPLFAWGFGYVFLKEEPALWIGFVLLMVTPCTDWYLVFTSIARGNLALSTAILPLNLIVQIMLLPAYLYLFGGAAHTIDFTLLMESILLVLFLPLVLSLLTKAIVPRRPGLKWISKQRILPVVFLLWVIVAMFAAQGEQLLGNLELLWKIFLPIMLFFVINFVVGQLTGRALRFSYEDQASLNLTTLASLADTGDVICEYSALSQILRTQETLCSEIKRNCTDLGVITPLLSVTKPSTITSEADHRYPLRKSITKLDMQYRPRYHIQRSYPLQKLKHPTVHDCEYFMLPRYFLVVWEEKSACFRVVGISFIKP